jgi:hypothetical protein
MNGRSGKIGQTNGHTCNFIMYRILSNTEILKKVEKCQEGKTKLCLKGNL